MGTLAAVLAAFFLGSIWTCRSVTVQSSQFTVHRSQFTVHSLRFRLLTKYDCWNAAFVQHWPTVYAFILTSHSMFSNSSDCHQLWAGVSALSPTGLTIPRPSISAMTTRIRPLLTCILNRASSLSHGASLPHPANVGIVQIFLLNVQSLHNGLTNAHKSLLDGDLALENDNKILMSPPHSIPLSPSLSPCLSLSPSISPSLPLLPLALPPPTSLPGYLGVGRFLSWPVAPVWAGHQHPDWGHVRLWVSVGRADALPPFPYAVFARPAWHEAGKLSDSRET